LSFLGVAAPSLLIYGGDGLDRVRCNTRAPAKACESRVYDGGRACDLPRSRGSRIPHSSGRIRRGVCGVLRAGVWCAITPISLLLAVVLRPETTSLDPLRDLTHGGLFVTRVRHICGLSPTSICGTTSFASGCNRAQARK
jgi:hypothetical protein